MRYVTYVPCIVELLLSMCSLNILDQDGQQLNSEELNDSFLTINIKMSFQMKNKMLSKMCKKNCAPSKDSAT